MTNRVEADEMALAWWPAPAGRAPLSRAAILDAAIDQIDRDGLDAFSMRKVAAALGVTTPALYGHVRNKEELLALAFDAILAQVELPEPDSTNWAEDLRRMARSWRATMLAHPEATRLSAAGMPLGPNQLRQTDAVFGLLRQAGLADRDVVFVGSNFACYCMGFSLFVDANNPIRQIERAGVSYETAKAHWEGMLAALPAESIPNIAALRAHLIGDLERSAEMFETGLDIFIDGVRTRLTAVRPALSTPTRGAHLP